MFRPRSRANALDARESNRRTDDHLEAILGEESLWAVISQQGATMSFAGNLRTAIGKAVSFGESGAVVVSVTRLPFDNIVITLDQIARLRERIAAVEYSPAK